VTSAKDRPIRVLVAIRPRLMRELVLNTLKEQSDIEIAGEVAEESGISAAVESTLPDFLIIHLDRPGNRPEICDSILSLHPEIRIIAVSADQNYSMFYWASLDIHSNSIEASEQGILDAVRHKLRAVGAKSS
jgi:DNA-binding NarL/FixJ family response regulator